MNYRALAAFLSNSPIVKIIPLCSALCILFPRVNNIYICRKPLINITIYLASGKRSSMYLEMYDCFDTLHFSLCSSLNNCFYMWNVLVDHLTIDGCLKP